MKSKPIDWNVVIAGSWNRAILTPNGIAKRLFKLPEGTGIQVMVPVDLLEPPKVKSGGIVASVDERCLMIGTESPTYETLKKAMEIGCNALQDLPETPVIAAGFNVRFEIQECPPELDDIVQGSLDQHLSDAGYEIVTRELRRKVRLKDSVFAEGFLNLAVQKDETGLIRIRLNFHRDSKKTKDLVKWLDIPVAKLKTGVTQVLQNICIAFKEKEDE